MMNERLKALCTEAFTKAWESKIVPDGMLKTDEEPYVFYEKFAELNLSVPIYDSSKEL